jgi:hypothetical protein
MGPGAPRPRRTASYLSSPPSTTPLGLDLDTPSTSPLEIKDRNPLAEGRVERCTATPAYRLRLLRLARPRWIHSAVARQVGRSNADDSLQSGAARVGLITGAAWDQSASVSSDRSGTVPSFGPSLRLSAVFSATIKRRRVDYLTLSQECGNVCCAAAVKFCGIREREALITGERCEERCDDNTNLKPKSPRGPRSTWVRAAHDPARRNEDRDLCLWC